jgi:dTMP kinase
MSAGQRTSPSYCRGVSSWPGFFISLEGIDGAGKSTVAAALADELSRSGRDVVVLRPADTQLGDLVRGYLLQHHQVPVDPWSEALLFTAGRVQLLRERILPALQAGAVVIADRYADSTFAYQGGGRGLPVAALRELHRQVCRDVWPDLTFLLDLPRSLAEERQAERSGGPESGVQQLPRDRFETAAAGFHTAVQAAFRQLAEEEPERIVRIDSSRPPAAVSAEISAVAGRRLAERRGAA